MPDRSNGGTRPALGGATLVWPRELPRAPEAGISSVRLPLPLCSGRGIAFRNRAPETVRVGIVASAPGAERARAALDSAEGLAVEMLASDSTADRVLQTGGVALVIAGIDGGQVEFRYDASRPDARTARMLVDDALQRAAGRTDPVTIREARMTARGSRYIDALIPGLLGLNIMGGGIWSIAFSVVTARNKKLLKRLVATPMSRTEYLLSFLISRLGFLIIEVGALVGFGALVFDVPV